MSDLLYTGGVVLFVCVVVARRGLSVLCVCVCGGRRRDSVRTSWTEIAGASRSTSTVSTPSMTVPCRSPTLGVVNASAVLYCRKCLRRGGRLPSLHIGRSRGRRRADGRPCCFRRRPGLCWRQRYGLCISHRAGEAETVAVPATRGVGVKSDPRLGVNSCLSAGAPPPPTQACLWTGSSF